MKVSKWLVSASFAAGMVNAGAWAQTAASSTAEASKDAAAPGEIVVTAQRRTENLMQTSISASVLTGADLANKGVVNVDALQFAMPSVTVNNFGQGNDFNVRGIGKGEHNTQTTTGVITYRDGAPTFPGYFTQEPYYDVANIQVLRGPQGTIVGQNATGGAVFVNSNDPVIGGGTHGYISANYGNYNDVGGQGAINLPISSTFAARVAFYGERRDSFYHITGPGGAAYPYNKGDQRLLAGRISLLWKPVEGLSILSKTDLDYLNMGGYPADPYINRFSTFPGTAIANPNASDLFNVKFNSPQRARDKFIRSILKVDYEFQGGTKFRSVTSYQKGNTQYGGDLDGTATANQYFYDSVDERQVSQEFNLISPDHQRLTWLIGAFALWNKYTFLPPYQFLIGVPPGNPASEYRLQGTNPERSLALFGQLGFAITPNLKLDLGGRYTGSRSTNHVDVLQYGTYIADQQRTSSHNFSYKASLGWKVTPDQYLYGFVATGFRPGGLNVPVGLGNPQPFDPEKVQSFELGWKGNFAGGHIRTTIDGFYNNYKNFQVIIGYPTFPTFGIELNVPNTTRIYGFEAEVEIREGGFSLDAGINALKSKLGQFYATDPRIAALAACNVATGPAGTSCINLKGRDQTYAPNFTFNVGLQYDWKLGNGDTITPRANYGHVGGQWATLFENPSLGDRLAARNILNAQLAWAHRGWTVTGYATNLTNQHYVAALNSGLDFAGAPRQYGVKVMRVF